MPKSSKGGYYAVRKGYNPGIYTTWSECQEQVNGFPGASYKKFNSAREAEEYVGVGITASISKAAPSDAPTISHTVASTSSSASHSTKPYERPKEKVKKALNELWDLSNLPKAEKQVVYTDGACKGNGKTGAIAGIGVWWEDGDERNLSERCPGDQTNNRAELIAIIRALETTPPTVPLLIKSDSQYSMNCMTKWLPAWRKNRFRLSATNQEIKNRKVIKYLARVLGNRPGPVAFEYVKGHSGERGNDGADGLAVGGCSAEEVPERKWRFKDWRTLGFEYDGTIYPSSSEDGSSSEGEGSGVIDLGKQKAVESKPTEVLDRPLTEQELAEFDEDFELSDLSGDEKVDSEGTSGGIGPSSSVQNSEAGELFQLTAEELAELDEEIVLSD